MVTVDKEFPLSRTFFLCESVVHSCAILVFFLACWIVNQDFTGSNSERLKFVTIWISAPYAPWPFYCMVLVVRLGGERDRERERETEKGRERQRARMREITSLLLVASVVNLIYCINYQFLPNFQSIISFHGKSCLRIWLPASSFAPVSMTTLKLVILMWENTFNIGCFILFTAYYIPCYIRKCFKNLYILLSPFINLSREVYFWKIW